MKSNWSESLREKLDQHYVWPALYTFKFIVPKGKEAEVKNLSNARIIRATIQQRKLYKHNFSDDDAR